MECVPDVFGCLRHDRKTGALKTVASGAWATQDFCESKNAAPRWTTKWCPAPAGDSEFPACGVRIVRGRWQDKNNYQCVTDPAATAHGSRKIAFACCDANTCSRRNKNGQCLAGDLRRLSNFAPKDWHEATNVCAAEGKVLCGVDKPCSRSGCSYDLVRDGSLGDGARRQEDRLRVLRGRHVHEDGRGRPVLSG